MVIACSSGFRRKAAQTRLPVATGTLDIVAHAKAVDL
jgi:hypothetical protein